MCGVGAWRGAATAPWRIFITPNCLFLPRGQGWRQSLIVLRPCDFAPAGAVCRARRCADTRMHMHIHMSRLNSLNTEAVKRSHKRSGGRYSTTLTRPCRRILDRGCGCDYGCDRRGGRRGGLHGRGRGCSGFQLVLLLARDVSTPCAPCCRGPNC